MSAIFGKIYYHTSNRISSECETMLNGYQKCVADRFHAENFQTGFMGCCQLFVQKNDEKDILPLTIGSICIDFDGMLDNVEELIIELGLPTDTPNGNIIYHAYKKWQIDMLSHLKGIYALAIYNKSDDTLFLANDRTASRCLYYYTNEKECIFSTLLRPILSVQSEQSPLSEQYLSDFAILPGLMPSLTPHETPYEHIFKLEPATYLLIKGGNILVKEHYWYPVPDSKVYKKKECGSAFMNLFNQCVAKAIDTPYEIGIAMSSGLDSSSVGAVAATLLRAQNRSLYSYTYVPITDEIEKTHDYDIVNEKEDVLKIVAMHPNMIPHFITNEGKDCYQELDTILDEMEIPIKSFVNSPILRYLYKSARQEGCRIVLNGQFGNSTVSYGMPDDILYHFYQTKQYGTLLWNQWKYCKRAHIPFLKDTKALLRYFGSQKRMKERYAMTEETLYPNFFSADLITKYHKLTRFEENGIQMNPSHMLSKEEYPKYAYSPAALSYVGEIETKFSLYCGVLIRDVTRDPDIIQFCLDIPYGAYMQDGLPRWLIRGNFKKYLPKEITHTLFRYGLQNGDWIIRLKPDWEQYRMQLSECLNQKKYKDYLNTNAINAFLDSHTSLQIDDTTLEQSLTELTFVYILIRYWMQNEV